MAENSEERKVKILLDAQQANASIKEMGAGAAIMKSQLDKMAQDDPRRAQLINDHAQLRERIQEAALAQRTYVKSTEELAREQAQLAQQNQEVILNGQKVTASFNDMKASADLLEQQLHALSADDPGRKKMLADYQALQERIDGVKKEMGETTEKGLTMKDALAFAGVGVGLEAAVDVVKEMGAEVVQTVQEFEKLRSSINGLTGATGEELDQLTTGVAGLAKTFGKEYDEVLVASNALAKQMGISQQEALTLLEKGFVAGADVNGEFLDQVKEYPAQFKQAGLSASEFIGVLSQSQTDGVFSDKGVDVVKEFGLRIREQTSATKDALYAAFGPEFTKEILDGVNNGSLTSVQALQRISQQMNDTQIPAAQLQTVIADVFGGPGEDAGLEYLQSLRNVGGGIDSLIDKTNPYVQRQQALLDSNKALAATQNDLAKEFEGTGTSLEMLGNNGLALLYTLLTSLIVTFKELFQPIQDIWNSFMELGQAVGIFSQGGTSAVSVGQALGNVIRALFTPTRLLWGALAEGAKSLVEWAKGSETARAALTVMAAPLRGLYELLMNGPAYFAGFSAAAESSFGTIGRAWQRIKNRDFGGAADEFKGIGKKAGDAYADAFAQAMAKKPAPAASTPAKADDPEAPKRAAGGDGTTEKDREKAAKDAETARAKAKAARDKADQEHLDAIKLRYKEEGGLLVAQDALRNQLGQRALSDEEALRAQQRQKLFDDADAQVEKLTGKEIDYTEQVKAIVEARGLALRELQTKFEAEDKKARQEKLEAKRAQNQADEEIALAELEVKLANGVLNEQTYEDAIYAVKKAAADRELALLKEQKGAESAEYKKAVADKLAAEADHITKKKKLEEDLTKYERALGAVKKALGNEELAFVGELFGKKSGLYKAFVAAQKATAIAEIGLNLVSELSSNSKNAAAFPPPFNGIYLLATNALSVVRAGVATAKVAGFREGGSTSAGNGTLDLNRLQVAPNGKLLDQDGFAVAGLVHENEYVIPEWMRTDPKVVQVESWLEEKRLRGYAQGGATSDGGSLAPVDEVSGSGEVATLLQQLIAEQRQTREEMSTWVREFKVVNQLHDFDQDYGTFKKVNNQNGISG
ncbi:hypothetical protein J0X19_22495 [Hymenobacter sp. BT186]|uniref:Phage tail tape measure protein domain-containing protein n=1 Tax=Hymenobacter telluris TaxID=2816474 RepID=A0A939JF84_9BACT|nr:phage tail tape measure protein [Hymenobacter telluris]MBO0360748.1 hypothetical protein [Hymenobacter telluris]MBW3376776.1 hypothetical protein [Hymenobacter norwichensis]